VSAPGPVRAAESTRADWETPPVLFRPLQAAYGFTLDVAASDANHLAPRYFAGPCVAPERCHCGLCSDWKGERTFCNPPYGPGLLTWCHKFAVESRHTLVVALLPSNTDTAWFANVYEHASELRFLTGRVQFLINGKVPVDANGRKTRNTGGTVVAIYRPMPKGLSAPLPLVSLWDWRGK
jgi:phage N-6-adenine-methyltransferase